jgi:transcription factor C subunit 7
LDSACDVGIGHERILLVSHAATTIGLVRALLGDEEIERRMRVGCCTLTKLHRLPSSLSSPSSSSLLYPTVPAGSSELSLPPPSPPLPLSFAAAAGDEVIGKGVWTVHGTPADGSFLAGGVERSWGMEDVVTHEGVVVEEDGIPGSEDEGQGEEDGTDGVQAWWPVGVPSPKM